MLCASGCSVTDRKPVSYLSDFKEFDGGYVTFGGRAKGGKITSKGTLKTSKLDFEDVYFVKELQFNIFSVSQMCDKKTEFFLQTTGDKGIKKDFSIARTPQQNGVAKRRNMTLLIEATRTMLADSKLPTTFWAKAVNTACYVQNRVLVVKPHNKTPYELFREKVLCSHSKQGDRIYQTTLWMATVKDVSLYDSSSKNASNDEPQPSSDAGKKDDEGVCKESGIADQEKPENSTQGVNTAGKSINTKPDMFSLGDNATLEATHVDLFVDEIEVDMSNIITTYPVPSTPNTRIHKDNSLDQCIGDVEPKKVTQALTDLNWIEAMQDDLLQFKLNKARLVAQGYTQEEGIDYDEVFAPVARIEAIRLFLAYASFMNFVVYQMDVKSAFLYGKIEEEVYVCQPPGFEDPEFPDRVYKVEKALYGLHQAPRAWYETLSTYLLENGFQRGTIDKTLFIKKVKGDILLVQVYVDDIIFGSTKKELCTEFEKLMHKKFQMSSMGELTFFLGLQVMQKEDGIFISQDKYVA
ncbi:retrovirus-related pol polyprotein from transposon TNT 1-94 [Tanacetum coccineum]|uniref:Retrovirus-related pol polyprotein from transposon TNT 1-94 n=1 Tax=Tanacetum coccineum TaxID=301880 RepID=A0ABQ5HKE9_9ASTR